jgi:hypothetical protein
VRVCVARKSMSVSGAPSQLRIATERGDVLMESIVSESSLAPLSHGSWNAAPKLRSNDDWLGSTPHSVVFLA